jgi:hypothetical protein
VSDRLAGAASQTTTSRGAVRETHDKRDVFTDVVLRQTRMSVPGVVVVTTMLGVVLPLAMPKLP